MHLAKKNIFGFATIAATVTLSATIFATGCGDSGDTTPAFGIANSPNTISLKYTADKDTLKADKINSLNWVVAKADGTLLAKGEKLAIKNIPTEKKDDKTAKVDTAKDTYAVLQLTENEFKAVREAGEGVTVTAIYYDSTAKDTPVLGFSSNTLTTLDWNYDSSDKTKKVSAETEAKFFVEKDAAYELKAADQVIRKDGTTKLEFIATQAEPADAKEGFTPIEANVIYFATPDKNDFVSITGNEAKGAKYTTEDGTKVSVNLTTASGKQTNDATIYVTDAKISKLTIKSNYTGVLLPEKTTGTNAVDYALGMTEVKGSNGSEALVTYGVGQTTMTAEVTKDDWKVEADKGVAPKETITLDKDVTYVANVGTTAAKAEEATVDGSKINFLQVKDFKIVGTYKTALAEKDGQVSGEAIITPVQPVVNIGLSTDAAVQAQEKENKIAAFIGEVKGEDGKEKSEALKMYAQFAPKVGEVSAFKSVLFAIPEFTYPSVAGLYTENATKDAPAYVEKFADGDFNGKYKAEIVGADKQKTNDYTITVREAGLNLKVGFGDGKEGNKYAEEQTAAFGNYKNLQWQPVTIK